MKKLRDTIALFALLAALALPQSWQRCHASSAGGAELPAGAPTREQLANATYRGILDSPVTLTDGRYEGSPYVEGGASRPRVVWAGALYAYGAFDADGEHDAVVFLSAASGGSGTQVYVAVVGVRGGKVVNRATAFLGDRVQVRGLEVRKGRIAVDVVQAGPEDAACCPTQLARRTWVLEAESLRELRQEMTGTLSVSTLAGTAWVLHGLDVDESVAEGVEVTLEFAADRVAGSSGCNRYFASYEGRTSNDDVPATLRIGPAASTRRMCAPPMSETEDAYLARLSQVTQFGFLMGRLALSWTLEDRYGILLFDPL